MDRGLWRTGLLRCIRRAWRYLQSALLWAGVTRVAFGHFMALSMGIVMGASCYIRASAKAFTMMEREYRKGQIPRRTGFTVCHTLYHSNMSLSGLVCC